MARVGGGRGRPRAYLAAVLATFVGAGLLYLVIATALVGLNPVAGTRVWPPQYSRLLRLRLYELTMPGRRVPSDLVDLARRTAIAEPLAFEPFVVHSRLAEQRGRRAAAIRLMEEARSRRNNFVPVRSMLADYYSRTGRLAEALAELEVLLRLEPSAIEPVMVELAKMISSADGRFVLASALAREPAWRSQFFAVARAQAVRPADARALFNEVRRLRPAANLDLERELYIQSLIDAGEPARARSLWLARLSPAERSRNRLMANPRFAGPRVVGPFGWVFSSYDVGRAELRGTETREPFVSVEYFGGSNALLAEQLLALPAGAYRLRFQLKAQAGSDDANTGSSRLSWNVACISGSPELLRVDLNRPTASYRRHEAAFTVPASNCGGQRLRLVAEAGDLPSVVNLNIAGLEIVR